MNEESQRIAIAEACGWKDTRTMWLYYTDYGNEGYTDITGISDITKKREPLPDYLNDLNAMHEAEKVLMDLEVVDKVKLKTKSAWVQYIYKLRKVCNPRRSKYPTHIEDYRPLTATAAQRAEAFLRTLDLWKEEA